MILLWGISDDGPMQAVKAALQDLGAPHVFLNQTQSIETSIETSSECGLPERVRTGDVTINLSEITAAYLRPYQPESFLRRAGRGQSTHDLERAWRLINALWTWADVSTALILNRPSAMAANGSKPWQLAQIAEFGFRTPDTLITNDPRSARKFWKDHGTVIYKSISGHRSTVSRLSRHLGARWGQLRWCPTQFQQHISGTDFRVHVVGTEIFSHVIHCEADDYRYPKGSSRRIEAVQLSKEDRARCVGLAQRLGLGLAGIDLRRTSAGEWYCFEVNPSPSFTFYQGSMTRIIDEAIARYLLGP
jgi:glutathione synthase/RimK-type ligase-like ATP-grasp enzyme